MKPTLVILLLLISACVPTSTVVKVAPEYAEEVKETSFSYIDNRPDEEKIAGRITLFTPVDRIDEKNLSISPMVLLKNEIEKDLGGKLTGATITIDHLEILNSYPKSANDSNVAAAGAIPYIVATLLNDANSDQIEDSVICHLEGRVNKKAFKLVTSESYDTEKLIWWSIFESENFKTTLNQVIKQCVIDGVSQIKNICNCDDD